MTDGPDTPAEAISEVAASGFGAGADAYEQGRPGYAPDVVTWLVDRLRIGPDARVLDLAAGTGKLTRLLEPTGASIVAVEPVDEMRAKLVDGCPGVEALAGTAESIPLPDRSVDAVTIAQAFHWFDPVGALTEIARVLRPGGTLGIVFNERDHEVPWVGELSRLIRWDERGRWRVPYTIEVDWRTVLAEHGPQFAPADRYDSRFTQPMDEETLVARVHSTSYIARMSPEEQAQIAAGVRAIASSQGETFELPYLTAAYATRLV